MIPTSKKELLHKAHIACGTYTSEQELAIAMVHRINESLRVLQILEVSTPMKRVFYHHYNHSVDAEWNE